MAWSHRWKRKKGRSRLAHYHINWKGGLSMMNFGISTETSSYRKHVSVLDATDSTHHPSGLFTKSAATVARTLASRRVSPTRAVSGLRMLTYFINLAGRGLSAKRRAE